MDRRSRLLGALEGDQALHIQRLGVAQSAISAAKDPVPAM